MKDFLGNEINIGDRAIRVHSYAHIKEFKVGTIMSFREAEYGDNVGFLTDGNERVGYTYPERIIIESAFNKPFKTNK